MITCDPHLFTLKYPAIGVFGACLSNDFHPAAAITRGLEFVAHQAECSLSFFNSYQSLEEEQILLRERLDGLVIFGSKLIPNNGLLKILARKIPMVLVQSGLSDLELNCVYSDNGLGGYIATRHLIALGHTHIAYITGYPECEFTAARFQGYQKALFEAKLPVRPELIATGDFSCRSGYLEMKDLLGRVPRCSAVFIANDKMAIGALRAVHEAGLTIPDDIAVIGCDDQEMASWLNPSVTMLQQPCFQMGKEAMLILISILNGQRKMDEGIKIWLNPELVLHDSMEKEEIYVSLSSASFTK